MIGKSTADVYGTVCASEEHRWVCEDIKLREDRHSNYITSSSAWKTISVFNLIFFSFLYYYYFF